MKTRHDFVSNSSSSSFVVMHSDNKHGVLLDSISNSEQPLRSLTLHQYIDEFWRREFQPCYWSSSAADGKVEIVPDQKFARLFAEGKTAYVLPAAAKDVWVELSKLRAQRLQKEKGTNSSICVDKDVVKMMNAEDELFDMLTKKVESALSDRFADEKFDYAEVSDHWDECYSDDPDCDYDDEVGKTRARIEYVNSLKPPKFMFREFNNH